MVAMKLTRVELILVVAVGLLAVIGLADHVAVWHRLAPIKKQLDIAGAEQRIADIRNDLLKVYPEMAPSATPAVQPQQAATPAPAATATPTPAPTPTITPTPTPAATTPPVAAASP